MINILLQIKFTLCDTLLGVLFQFDSYQEADTLNPATLKFASTHQELGGGKKMNLFSPKEATEEYFFLYYFKGSELKEKAKLGGGHGRIASLLCDIKPLPLRTRFVFCFSSTIKS
jgi:hypothetical protein